MSSSDNTSPCNCFYACNYRARMNDIADLRAQQTGESGHECRPEIIDWYHRSRTSGAQLKASLDEEK